MCGFSTRGFSENNSHIQPDKPKVCVLGLPPVTRRRKSPRAVSRLVSRVVGCDSVRTELRILPTSQAVTDAHSASLSFHVNRKGLTRVTQSARVVVILAVSLLAGTAPAARQQQSSPAAAPAQQPSTDTSRGLAIQYADGRTLTRPLRQTGGMWTPGFPRIAGAETARNGVPLTTLDVKHVVDGADVIVSVSLFYGGPWKNAVAVATVRVSADKPVEVGELRAYGVEPIILSIVRIPQSVAFAPDAVSASAQLDVRVEPVGSNVSAYRLLVKNRSPFAVMWMQIKGYRGEREAISGRPRGKRNAPLILPNAGYSHEITLGGSGAASGEPSQVWHALDRIEITTVLWQDGLVEGDPDIAAQQARFDIGKAAHIRQLVEVLRGARRLSIPNLRTKVAGTMSYDVETRQARDMLLAELDTLQEAQRSSDGQALDAWLTKTIAEYERWVARIVLPRP